MIEFLFHPSLPLPLSEVSASVMWPSTDSLPLQTLWSWSLLLTLLPLCVWIGVYHIATLAWFVGRVIHRSWLWFFARKSSLATCITDLPIADDEHDNNSSSDGSNTSDTHRTTLVIGAGAAGCAAAFHLALRADPGDVRHIVTLESASCIGGRARTYRNTPFPIDSGAGFFGNFYTLMWNYIRIFGKDDQVLPLQPKAILRESTSGTDWHDSGTDGSCARSHVISIDSLWSLIRFPLLSLVDKVRFGIRVAVHFVFNGCRISLFDPIVLSCYDTESACVVGTSMFGRRLYHYVLRPAIESFWYFECSQASGALLLALLAELPTARFYTLRNGMDSVCQWLLDSFLLHRNCSLRTDCLVTGIELVHSDQAHAQHPPLLTVTYIDYSSSAAGIQRTISNVDELLICTTADVASTLIADLPDSIIHRHVRSFVDTQLYACNVHITFLVKQADLQCCRVWLNVTDSLTHSPVDSTDNSL
jgi:hypothetical protein